MTALTPKYHLPYPIDSDPVTSLPTTLQKQAQAIESCLGGFDFDGQDAGRLAARVTSLEQLITSIRANTVMLFNNDQNPLSGSITLADTAANFEMLTICYRSNDNVYASMDVINPDGKIISLVTGYISGATTAYLKNRCYSITGKIINTYKRADGVWIGGQVNAANSNNADINDYLTITQVYGTRKVQIV
ncbi:hypothetical protein [Bifidobacterium crudilactis]|uniref:hypothetical protein n=1 Tax=Bifidobacterium crudilactis TaxID=327277 RepID=UPI002355D2F9|nr:hypothetical protein [Bifidobacterium crudilactis]MCI2148850.1 hypothetical protein [Bifidobacterium crudilactis]MCI2158284.1 hypothetical protein [Bifidobacterium crudilactis]